MKKFIIISLFLFPFFSYAQFSKDLYYGVRGDAEVQALQEFLADQGHYTGAASGNFFSLTLSAVKKFQVANNISPTSGYFGPKTRAKANQILEVAGVSADSVKNEDNAPVSASVVVPKTANDIVASLASQIALLQQQLATLQKNQDALQQQNQSLQTIQQQQAAQTQQIAQQTKTLQQIQTNTTSPAPTPVTAPVIMPDLHIFDVRPSGNNCKIKQDGKLQCQTSLEVVYKVGKSMSSLDNPKGVSITATSPLFDSGKSSQTTYFNNSQNVAIFYIPSVSQNGTYLITFSAEGASYDYNFVVNLDPIKNEYCRYTESGVLYGNGAFCESKDIAWLDMTPRVRKITDEKELRQFGINGINYFGLLRLAGVSTLPFNYPYPVSFTVNGKDYTNAEQISLSPFFIASQNAIILKYDQQYTKPGNYEVAIKSLNFFGDKDREIQFSGLPITYSIVVP